VSESGPVKDQNLDGRTPQATPTSKMSTLFGKNRKPLSKRKRTDVDDSVDAPFHDSNDGSKGNKTPPSRQLYATTLTSTTTTAASALSSNAILSFEDLGLVEPLVKTCRQLGFRQPTPVQRTLIPFLIGHRHCHVLAIAATGTGKTAAYLLPILHHLSMDPYGVYAVILTPTRELAQQVHQQVLALGAAAYATLHSVLVVGGLDSVAQSVQLDQKRPHFVVATPGRLAALLRGPQPPRLHHVRYLVLDEADRLLASSSSDSGNIIDPQAPRSSLESNSSNCGFERDVAEILLHCRGVGGGGGTGHSMSRDPCQTLLFSATVTASLQKLEEMAGNGSSLDGSGTATAASSGSSSNHGLPLRKFVIRQGIASDKPKANDKSTKVETTNASNSNEAEANAETTDLATTVGVKIPNGLQQEYVFMPSRVRDACLLATVRTLLANGGRSEQDAKKDHAQNKRQSKKRGGANSKKEEAKIMQQAQLKDDSDDPEAFKAKSAIIFVATCERAALVSGILDHVGVANVALHSLLSQHRRLAALGKFQSELVRVMVATDVAARGLDIPHTDLVINAELPRNPVNYVHRVGRTARAGRRGRAVSLVSESDVALVHAAEQASGRELVKCTQVTDELALTMLGPAAKAARLTKLKLADIGFDELVHKMKERKVRDRLERQQRERRALARASAASKDH
jgi:superfamily II DNA/RNA helicase